jgi:uncharacterized protein
MASPVTGADSLLALATVSGSVGDALSFAFGMFRQILWALILGFFLSGAVQAVVRKSEMRRLMGDDSPRSLALASGLGAASSSCSYAAVALARSLFRKGADFTAAMAFEIASTNLVVELGIIMVIVLGWQFTVGEFVGGPLMIVIVALLFRRLLTPKRVQDAREQADRGLLGSMEGHAARSRRSGDRSSARWSRSSRSSARSATSRSQRSSATAASRGKQCLGAVSRTRRYSRDGFL